MLWEQQFLLEYWKILHYPSYKNIYGSSREWFHKTAGFFRFAIFHLKAACLQVVGLGVKFDIKMFKNLFSNHLF